VKHHSWFLFPRLATALRFDASFLPFPEGRVSAFFDRLGAIWHEATVDIDARFERAVTGINKPSAENTLDIFARLRKYLHVGGVIIIDQDISSGESTAAKVDKVLGTTTIPGFETSVIGQGENKLRVYKKSDTEED
jgi:hypothetical protein